MNIRPVVLVLSHEERQTDTVELTRARNVLASLCLASSSNLLPSLLESPISCHVISSLSLVIHVIHSERDGRSAALETLLTVMEMNTGDVKTEPSEEGGRKEDLPTFSIPFYFI
jgi:hypothetical protein